MKLATLVAFQRRKSCSSQEEHVLKRILVQEEYEKILLLLARGACIETIQTPSFAPANSCSSQEEHVLKQAEKRLAEIAAVLLLARGACIETLPCGDFFRENVLLLARGACIETLLYKSS